MTDHIKTVAIFVPRTGKALALRTLLDGMLAPSRAEPGNLRYDLWSDQTDPDRLVLDELYVNADAVAAHRETPHFRHYASVIGDLAERTVLALVPAAVA